MALIGLLENNVGQTQLTPMPGAVVASKTAPLAETQKGFESVPADVRAKALERFNFVRLVQDAALRLNISELDAVRNVSEQQAAQFPILLHAGQGESSALTYFNYRQWKRRISLHRDRSAAMLSLCDNYTRGVRERKGDKVFWNLFFGNFLNLNCLPLTVAYNNACAVMQKDYKGVPVPTEAQVRYQVALLDPEVLIKAREGDEAWKNKCGDYIRRDWSEVKANECAIGDSRTFDTRVRVYDEEKQKWVAVRPTIAGLMDAKSWYLVGYWLTTEPVNANTLIDTLKLYLANNDLTPPQSCYFDNGKDYCAQGFATDLEVEGGFKHSIFKENGIKLKNSLPYNARAKTIERAFRDMMQQYDKQFPDYLGSKPGERTLGADYFEKHPEELPDMQQFSLIFARWLNDWHNTPKCGDIHGGKSPAEIWASRDRHSSSRTHEEIFLACLRPVGLRQVGRGGCVTHDKTSYYSDALTWGKKVLVKVDTRDAEHIYCFTPDGSLICEARTRDRIHALNGDPNAIAALMKRQRTQEKALSTVIAELTGGLHVYSPIEILLAAPDAKQITGDTISKVKGPAHHYTHHSLGVIAPAETKMPTPAPAMIEFREDRELEALNEAHAAVTASHKDTESDDISAAHEFMINKNRGGNDDE